MTLYVIRIILAVQGLQRPQLTAHEVTDSPRRARWITPTLKVSSDIRGVKAMVEDVAVAINEAEVDLLETLADVFHRDRYRAYFSRA
jgi:hypothetical protein